MTAELPSDISRSPLIERRWMLLWALPLIAANAVLYGLSIRSISSPGGVELAALTLVAVVALASWALLAGRRIDEDTAGMAITLATGIGIATRLVTLFASGLLDDPAHSYFMPIFSYWLVYYLIALVALPYPRSRTVCIAAWLGMAVYTTGASLPHWLVGPRHYALLPTLVFIWCSHALFLALLFSWVRQRHQLLQSLASSEQRSRTVFEQAMAGIGLIDGNAAWIEVNARLATLTGYTADELRGKPLCELLPAADREAARGQMRAFLAQTDGPDEFSIDSGWQRKDGSLIWLSRQVRRVPPVPGAAARAMMMVFDISDRKRAESEAAERRTLEHFQFAHSPMSLIEWTSEMKIRRWSAQAEKMFGWTEAEVVGRTLREAQLISAAEADEHERVMREFIDGRREASDSLRRILCKDGRHGWSRWFTRIMRDAEGRIQFFYSAGVDVTELRQANEALERSQGQLQAIFDQAAVGIALLDEQGRWLRVNQRLCEITGYSEDELRRLDFQTITHPDDLGTDVELAAKVASGAIPSYTIDKRYLHKRGHLVWIRLNVGRIDATATTPMRFVSVIEDISERRRIERESTEHRRIREFHVENTPLAVIEWTPDFRVSHWSHRAEAMFGWRADEVMGRHPREFGLIHASDSQLVDRVLDTMQVRGQPMTTVMNRNIRKDGRPIWCHWYNSVLHGPDGSTQSLYSMVDDVTEEQAAIAALRDSQARFRSVFEQAAVGIAMVDADSHWMMVNRRFSEIVGYSSEKLLTTTCLAITDAQDVVEELKLRQRLLAGEIDDYQFEKRYRRPDGSAVWVSIFARRLDQEDGGVPRLALVIEDITQRRESERQLQELHAQLEAKVARRTEQLEDATRRWADSNQELSVLAEMMTALPAARDRQEANLIVASFLPRLFRRYGGEVWIEEDQHGAFARQADWNLATPGPAVIGVDDCWALRRGQTLRVDDRGSPLICPHGHDEHGHQQPHACVPILALGDVIGLIHVRWAGTDADADAGRAPDGPDRALLASTAEQIGLAIGNVRLREELRRQALRDPLTGLYNRRHLEETLRRRESEHRRHGRRYSVLMIDVDHFKKVNDSHGHDAGDEVLRAIGASLQRSVRTDEAVFRLGGEEFVVLLNDQQGTDLAGAAERVRADVEKLCIDFKGATLSPITVSIGAAHFPKDASTPAELLVRADQALYDAKRTGRNRVCFASAHHEQPPRMAAVGRIADAQGSRSRRAKAADD